MKGRQRRRNNGYVVLKWNIYGSAGKRVMVRGGRNSGRPHPFLQQTFHHWPLVRGLNTGSLGFFLLIQSLALDLCLVDSVPYGQIIGLLTQPLAALTSDWRTQYWQSWPLLADTFFGPWPLFGGLYPWRIGDPTLVALTSDCRTQSWQS